jgi:diguanylate cyclase (GGDEF)-like protein
MHQIQQLEDQLAKAPNDAARLDALNELALNLARAGIAERAMQLAREAERLAIARDDDDALALALCNIGMSRYLHADYAPALETCLHALVVAERARNPEAIASALITAAANQYQMGAREEALQALYQALEAIEAAPCDPLSMRAHNALGIILCDKGAFEDSEAHYRGALEIGSQTEDANYVRRVKVNYAGLHHERGLLLARGGKTAQTHACFLEGIRLCEEVLSDAQFEGAYNKAHCVGTLGELYRDLGKPGIAQQFFAEMLAHGTAINNPHQQAEALMNLGKNHMALGNSAEARRHLERSLELSSGANVRRLAADAFLELAGWFEASGDLPNAVEHHKRFHALHDEVLRGELRATAIAHQIWLDFQKLRRDVKRYQKHAESLARDNGELSQRIDRLARVAHEDAVTGLSNRRYLDLRLPELVAAVHEHKSRLCVGIVDIDHFKSINDVCSHSVGDAVLRTVAHMISAHCREGDVSARYGGDEFVICLVDARLDAAMTMLERLRSLVEVHDWSAMHADLNVTLSIGVSEIEVNDSVATLMHRVDLALYRAKHAGRNRVVGDAGRGVLH